MRVKTAPCAISQLYFNTKYGHYKMVQNYDIIELTIAIITEVIDRNIIHKVVNENFHKQGLKLNYLIKT